MILVLASLFSALSGCEHEFSLILTAGTSPPLPVALGPEVEIPAGIAVVVGARVERNGEPFDAPITLESASEDVFDVAPLLSTSNDDGVFLFSGVTTGVTELYAEAGSHDLEPTAVTVVAQPDPASE